MGAHGGDLGGLFVACRALYLRGAQSFAARRNVWSGEALTAVITMAEIRIQNLTKQFGDFTAVKDLNLTIADGEFLILLGPSGCGKTTTLRSIAGLERQTSGDIFIGGRKVNELSPGDRDIAMVFQFYALYPHLTAYDNIAFPLRASNRPASEIDASVGRAAKLLRIEYLLKRKPNRMSGGEQQRVALGRAIVRRPSAFLMDEPLTNLDAKLRADMRAEIKHLQRELNTTMVYVTHDQTEAMSMAQRIAVMNQGVLQQVGTPLGIYDHPATLFVAGFIGSPPMNFVDVALKDGEAPMLTNVRGDFKLLLAPQLRNMLMEKQNANLRMGIRSEDVQVIPNPADGDLKAQVYVREPLGDEIIYDLKIGDQMLRAKAPPTLRLNVGDRAGLKFDQTRLHLFDLKTEQAII
jgi:ABC-type sugar transport system ATPase subunit